MLDRALSNPSVMQHRFSDVPQAEIPRSSFRRSHTHKTAFDAGYLIPIYCDEALPGDTFHLNLTSISRLATPVVPIMDNLTVDYFFFFVPNRLLWTNWQKFMGEQDNPGDSIDFVVPQIDLSAGAAVGSLSDYFGIPTGITNLDVNSLHYRAYNLIYNEWFRDQNLQNSVVVDLDDGPDDPADYVLLRRGKRHDYFTSCLPWPQKGTAVDLPLGTTAPVIGDGKAMGFLDNDTNYGTFFSSATSRLNIGANARGHVLGTVISSPGGQPSDFEVVGLSTDAQQSHVFADLSSATAATINSLRESFQLQRMLERDARSGTRYTEILQAHFRVTSPDARLQRPEYLGGGSRDFEIQAVPQTSQSATSPQGTLAGVGYHQSGGIGFTKSFVEHGVLLGLVSIRADLTYQQGINRMWSRQTKHDFYWPALAHLGEQEVLNKELYAQGTTADDNVFGYQERWAEYRYKQSLITGKMRSSDPNSLDVWHLSQDFGALPALNAAFIEDNPPVDRVIATVDEPQFIFDAYFDCVTVRPMPIYSVPGLIDHF